MISIVSVCLFVVQKCCQKPRPGARAYDHAIRAQWYMGGLFVWSACLLKTRHHKKKITTTGATPPLPDCNWKLDFLTKQETATRWLPQCRWTETRYRVFGQRHEKCTNYLCKGTVSDDEATGSLLGCLFINGDPPARTSTSRPKSRTDGNLCTVTSL